MRFVLNHEQVNETLELKRPFSHVIRIDGLKSGLNIPVECAVMQLDYRLITPRRLKLMAGLRFTSGEVELYNYPTVEGVRIYWKNKPRVLPPQQVLLRIDHIFKLPQDRPAARQITSVTPSIVIHQAGTLTNRLVINGELRLQIAYRPR